MFGRKRVSRDDRGAIAVLACIVVGGMLLPVMALAVTAHVREGAAAELQRAAEVGALAGAANIPLGDLSMVNAYTSGLGLSFPPAWDPLVIACNHARRAMQSDGSINDAFSPQGTTLPANFCRAEYTADPTFLSRLGQCLNLEALLRAIPLVGPLVANLLFSPTKTIVPGLLHAGVKVTLTRTVRGPFDSMIGGSATAQTAQAAAKRRFKNALVLPDVGVGSIVNVSAAALGTVVDATLGIVGLLNNVLNAVLAPLGCRDLLGLLADDLRDLLDPPGTGPTIGQVVNDALATGEQLLALRSPSNPPPIVLPLPLLGGGSAPAFDFVPVCLRRVGGTVEAVVQNPLPNLGTLGGCVANAAGIFRATLVPVT